MKKKKKKKKNILCQYASRYILYGTVRYSDHWMLVIDMLTF